MKKRCNVVEGEIISVSKPIKIERQQKASFTKVTMGLRTDDGQIIFFEVRDILSGWDILKLGETATVEYYFAGSTRGDKVYNNIIAKSINV